MEQLSESNTPLQNPNQNQFMDDSPETKPQKKGFVSKVKQGFSKTKEIASNIKKEVKGDLSKASAKAAAKASAVKGDFVKGAERTKEITQKELSAIEKKVKSKAHKVKDQIIHSKIGEEVKKGFDKMENSVKKVILNVRQDIEKWAKAQIEKNLRKLLAKAPPMIKKELKSPYMFQWVREMIDDLVDDIWPEIEEEIVSILRFKYDYIAEYPIPPKPYNNCCTRFSCCLRNWYLYTNFPVDKDTWHKIRSWSYWILILISLFPFYLVSPIFYVLVFIFIDKSDEFQVLNYILRFKKIQFISAGLVRGIMGFILYYICVNFDGDADDEEHSCDIRGPGAKTYYYIEAGSFALTIVLTWLGIMYLACAEKKGEVKFAVMNQLDEENQIQHPIPIKSKRSCLCKCCFKTDECRGGRIWCFIIYDTIIFLLCCLIFVVGTTTLYSSHQDREWQLQADLYWAQFAYGIGCFPFLVFNIPFCTTLITKTRETGYDKEGRCLPKYICQKKYIKRYGNPLKLHMMGIDDVEEDLIQVESLENDLKLTNTTVDDS